MSAAESPLHLPWDPIEREARGMSDAQIGSLIGTSRDYIGQCRRRGWVTWRYADRLAIALERHPSELWGDDWWLAAMTGIQLSVIFALHDDSRDQTWRGQAACKGKTPLFFARDEHDRDAAITICRGCPVIGECLDDAVSRPLDDDPGIRAGLTRRKLADTRHARLRASRERVSA